MKRRNGLIVTSLGGNVQDERDIEYDSRNSKLTTDTKPEPPHLDVFERDGGTRVTLAPGESYKETLETFTHRMPFQPLCFMYFYQVESPTNYGGDNLYSIDREWMERSSLLTDIMYMNVNKSSLSIRRYAEVSSDRSDSYTFKADEFTYRIRYMIFSQEDYRTLWDSYDDAFSFI